MDDSPRPSGWKRFRRWIPLLVFALVALSFAAFRIASGSGLKREVEAIRQRGLPINAIELDLWYPRVPAASNAALAMIDAFAYHIAPAVGNNPNELPFPLKPGEALNPELAEAVAAYVEKNQPALEALHEAAMLTTSRYPIDLTKGYETLLPHLANVKRMAYLVKWDAIHKSARGEREPALRSLHSGFALVASLRDEPLLISELVRMAIIVSGT